MIQQDFFGISRQNGRAAQQQGQQNKQLFHLSIS